MRDQSIRTIIYIYIYWEDFAQQYGKCGARSGSPQLFTGVSWGNLVVF